MSGTQRGPGGVALAPGESALVDDRFMFSTIAFYLHTELALTNRRFMAARPSTVAGLLPVGTSRASYPIENIAGINAGTRFDVFGVILGLFGLAVGLAAFNVPSIGGLGFVLVVLGLGAIVGAPKQFVEVMNSGGGTIRFPVSVFERGRTLEFASRVSEAIARTAGAPTPNVRPPVGAAPPADASRALRQLEELRSQGLITGDEYAEKRRAVLARL